MLVRYGWEMDEIWVRNGWDMGEIWVRCGWNMGVTWVGYWWDMGKIWVSYGWDMGEIWVRYGWDMGEIWVRYGWDVGEKWVRYWWSKGSYGSDGSGNSLYRRFWLDQIFCLFLFYSAWRGAKKPPPLPDSVQCYGGAASQDNDARRHPIVIKFFQIQVENFRWSSVFYLQVIGLLMFVMDRWSPLWLAPPTSPVKALIWGSSSCQTRTGSTTVPVRTPLNTS